MVFSSVLPGAPDRSFEAIVLLVEICRDVFFLIRKIARAKLFVAIADLGQQLRRGAHPPLAAKIDLIRIAAKASRMAAAASLAVEWLAELGIPVGERRGRHCNGRLDRNFRCQGWGGAG